MVSDDKQKKIDTNDLMNILGMYPVIEDVFGEIGDDITNPILCEYLTELLKMHEHTPTSMIQRANLSKSYAYQILDGTRIPNRNLLIRISLAINLNIKETQRLLTISQRGALYPRVRRDAAIIFCINRRSTPEQANDLLEDIGEAALM